MAVVIKTFETPGGKYVYDREMGSVLSVTDDEFLACKRVEKGEAQDADWQLLEKYKVQGYLKESKLKKIEHNATRYMKHHLNGHMSQMTLQTNQTCNLRCSYCTYGGKYEHQRTHANKTMSIETIKKSVDFFMEHSRGVEEVTMSFYGGEALLEIERIKACVDYIKEAYKGKVVRYTITTNGTVINKEIIDFLEKCDVGMVISLDGPKEIHDINRVFEDGSGSFDKIMDNLQYIKEHHPELFTRVRFLATIAPGTDFSCVNEYFNVADIMGQDSMAYNMINSYGSKENIVYDDLYSITYNFNYTKVLLSALGLYDNNKISKLFHSHLLTVERLYERLTKRPVYEIDHHGGPCLPGVMRPMVAVDGTILPCERVNEESEIMKIGHIDTGFDMDKIDAMLNVGRLTDIECKTCWGFQHCGLCVSACDGGGSLSKKVKLNNCYLQLEDTLNNLKTICLLLENGYDFSKFNMA